MKISLNFAQYQQFHITESRLSRLMHTDRTHATKMGVWDHIKDFFRKEKKSEALNTLYTLLYNDKGKDKLDAFNQLRTFALPVLQDQFVKKIDNNEIQFIIGQYTVEQCAIQPLLNIDDDISILPMSPEEEHLFLMMLDTLRECENNHQISRLSDFRDEMSLLHCNDINGLYRPQSDPYYKGSEWITPQLINETEKTQLKCLNAGSFNEFTQFCKIGYQEEAGERVVFSMVHPAITYLLGTYTRIINLPDTSLSPSDFTAQNSGFIQVFNQDYSEYMQNKAVIDEILARIYHEHGATLDICVGQQNRNKLTVAGIQ